MRRLRTLGRVAVVLLVAAAVALSGWFVFVEYPTSLTELAGVVLALVTVVAGLQVGARIARSALPDYNVAEVAVQGPIQRESGGFGLPTDPTSPGADDVVDQIERADADRHVDALLLKLNTPGGEVVPSDDIRAAAVAFDGPTLAYTNDLCASGGMWIASGCDELWAREASLVGSVGVLFSQLRVHDLFEDYGVSYERIVSGDYKDALSSFKALDEDERAYLQALADAWYDHFVQRVAEGTEMDAQAVRDTEARIYLGEQAAEMGMVDALGDRAAVEDHLSDLLETEVTVQEFTPSRGLRARLGAGALRVAHAVGAGMARAGTDAGLRMRGR